MISPKLTIQISGQNTLTGLAVMGHFATGGCAVDITGNGSLTIDATKAYDSGSSSSGYVQPAVVVNSHSWDVNANPTLLKVGKDVKLTLKTKPEGDVVRVESTNVAAPDQAIQFATKPQTPYTVTTTALEDREIKMAGNVAVQKQIDDYTVQYIGNGEVVLMDTINWYWKRDAVYSSTLGGYVVSGSSTRIFNLDELDSSFEPVGESQTVNAYDVNSYQVEVYKGSDGKEFILEWESDGQNSGVYRRYNLVAGEQGIADQYALATSQTISEAERYNYEPIVLHAEKNGLYDHCIKLSSLVVDPTVSEKEEIKTPEVGTKETDQSGTANYKVIATDKDGVKVSYVSSKKDAANLTIPDTVTLADGTKAKVTSVEKNAFKNNKKVKKVTLGKNIESIGGSAFQGAKKLETVTIGENVTSIGNNAFKSCENLKTVKVKGSSVKTVGSGAFQGAKKLTSVSLGKNVTSIGKNAFNGCKKLKSITITSTKVKTFGTGAFKGISSKATITVPKKQFSKYKAALKKAGLPKGVTVKKAKK